MEFLRCWSITVRMVILWVDWIWLRWSVVYVIYLIFIWNHLRLCLLKLKLWLSCPVIILGIEFLILLLVLCWRIFCAIDLVSGDMFIRIGELSVCWRLSIRRRWMISKRPGRFWPPEWTWRLPALAMQCWLIKYGMESLISAISIRPWDECFVLNLNWGYLKIPIRNKQSIGFLSVRKKVWNFHVGLQTNRPYCWRTMDSCCRWMFGIWSQ